MTAIRVVTALILAPGVLALVWWAPPAFFAGAVGLIIAFALQEFFAIGEKAHLHGYWLWTGICGVGLAVVQSTQSQIEKFGIAGGMSFVKDGNAWVSVENLLLAFVLGITLAGTMNRRPVAETLGAVGLSAAALLLVALPLSYVVRVQGMEGKGRIWMMFLLWLVWAGDSCAYFVGRAFGRFKMAPEISPGKTWEGAAGNLAGSLVVGAVFAQWLEVPPAQMLLVAALANFAGQAGDLLESAYKRSAGVKDSGTILPGHGGVLDRIDALIFAAPVVWVCMQFLNR